MIKALRKRKNFILKSQRLKKKFNSLDKSDFNDFEVSSRKEVKNLDFFKPNIKKKDLGKKININFKTFNFDNFKTSKDMPNILEFKIKSIIEDINILKRNKLNIIKIHKFSSIVNYFNKNNKIIFFRFKELGNLFMKIKNKENSEINNNITMLNDLNYKKENLDNKLKYLKSNYEFNNSKLKQLIEKKHFYETKNKKMLQDNKNSNVKRRSVFVISNRINDISRKSSNASKIDVNTILKNVKKKSINMDKDKDKNKKCSIYSRFNKKPSIMSRNSNVKIKINNNSISSDLDSSISSMESNLEKINNKIKVEKNNICSKNLINLEENSVKNSNKRKVLNDFSIINIEIINLTNTNNTISKDIEKYKYKEKEIKNKINELEIDIKYRNNLMNVINKLDKKYNKNLIIFLKDEIEFGFDIKSNGIIWLYFEIIKLNHFKLEIYPHFLNEKYKVYLKNLVDNFILIFKKNNRLNNIKIFNKLLINNNNKEENFISIEDSKPSYFKETEKIKINKNLYNFKRNFKYNNTQETNYICDQNYKLPSLNNKQETNKNFYKYGKNIINEKIIRNKNTSKIVENNFNIKFIDENDIINFVNIKTMNIEKKNIFKDIKNKFNNIEVLIKASKKKFINSSIKLLKKYGFEKIIKISSSLHGTSFSYQIFKEKK